MSRPKLKDTSPTGPLDERRLPDGRRKIKLRKAERQQLLRNQLAEAAAALFLDLEEERTWAEIAQELQISPTQLRDLTKSPEFNEAYCALFAELGHDPRFRAAQASLSDLLPVAILQLRKILTQPSTSAGVRLRAVEKVLQLNGLKEPEQQASDRKALAEFLVTHNIRLESVGMYVPKEYEEAYSDVVDGEVAEPPEELPSGE
jgi:hypothetical protein